MLLLSSADSFQNQFFQKNLSGTLSECQSCSVSKPFDTLIVFLKEFFEIINFEKKSADDNKSTKNYPACINNKIATLEMAGNQNKLVGADP